MARREIRSSWRRLLFFFLCIAIGVGAIVAVRSIIRNLNHVLSSDARVILGADVQVASNRPWKPETLTSIERVTGTVATARTETIESASMLRPADVSKGGAILVELKGIEVPYPLYGQYKLADGAKFNHSLLANNGILVARSVLERLNLKTGDRVKLGEAEFHIRGVLEHEPGSGAGFRFGPRVIVNRKSLESAGLTGFGSRARRKILLQIPESRVAAITQQLRKSVKSDLVNIRSFKESQENLEDQFTRAENFLALTGLVILVLGGIGISSVTRVFIEQKKKSIAVLKCVGATGRKITTAYLVQILALGSAGSLLGVGLARFALYYVKLRYALSLPAGMNYSLQEGAVVQGLAFGLLVTILFAALPLLRIRNIKPNVLLREETEFHQSTIRRLWKDPLRWITGVLVMAGLVFLASWQGGSLRVGLFFLGGLLATAAALHLGAVLLVRILRKGKPLATFSLRHAISGLHRPGNQTYVIIMAVGLGSFFIIAIHTLQSNLLRELDFTQRSNMPNMYLIDVQTDQRQGVARIVKEASGETAQLIPTVRARIAAINGKELDPESEQYKKDRRRLGFEYTMTYRPALEPNETVLAGRFWNRTPSFLPEVSIEESLKGMMDLDVGGTITFDILGRRVTAKVTSIRRVDWQNSRTGFYVVFRPGTLEKAPNVYIAALNAPTTEPARSRFQRTLVDTYPNITAIDVAEIVDNIKRILNNVTLAVSFVGSFVFLSGILILIGSVTMTKFQRIYEAAVLKVLGAKRKIILTILVIEYGLLGTVAGIVGSLAAMGLSYLIGKHVFEIPWHATPLIYVTGIVLTTLLVIFVGAASSLDVLNRKPLAILRNS